MNFTDLFKSLKEEAQKQGRKLTCNGEGGYTVSGKAETVEFPTMEEVQEFLFRQEEETEEPQEAAVPPAPKTKKHKEGKPMAKTQTKPPKKTPEPSENGKAEVAKPRDKAGAFEKLAAKRMNQTLDWIRKLQNLASPNYEYTEEQVSKILEALRAEVDALEEAFEAGGSAPARFSF